MRTQTKTKKTAQFILRENAENKIIIVTSFASDWLRGWCKFSRKITMQSEAKIYNPGLDI